MQFSALKILENQFTFFQEKIMEKKVSFFAHWQQTNKQIADKSSLTKKLFSNFGFGMSLKLDYNVFFMKYDNKKKHSPLPFCLLCKKLYKMGKNEAKIFTQSFMLSVGKKSVSQL